MTTPPAHAAALGELLAALRARGVADPLSAPLAALEVPLRSLLPEPFDLEQPGHAAIALGLGALVGAKLAAERGAFWFPQREAEGGAALGFPEVLLEVRPVELAASALADRSVDELHRFVSALSSRLAAVRNPPGL